MEKLSSILADGPHQMHLCHHSDEATAAILMLHPEVTELPTGPDPSPPPLLGPPVREPSEPRIATRSAGTLHTHRRSLSTASKLAHIKEIKLHSDTANTDKQIRPEIYSSFKKKEYTRIILKGTKRFQRWKHLHSQLIYVCSSNGKHWICSSHFTLQLIFCILIESQAST